MYGAELADIYELLHERRGKDFEAESRFVARQVRERCPAAVTLLDVACGTGSHLRHFSASFAHVEGLERSEPMLRRAKAAAPAAVLHAGDMRDFDLGRTFDAITCMFGSIGYMATTAELGAALTRMAHHLAPGGVVVIDPWWFSETFLDGHVSADLVDAGGATLVRVSHSARAGASSRMQVHYIVAEPAGARHFVETHVISLFTRAQYEAAFTAAGLQPAYLPGVQSGRGLFVAVRAAPHPLTTSEGLT